MKRPHVADCPVAEGRNGLLPIFREENDEEGEEELGSEKKRRLKAEQVWALERSFEAENKLDPERKARLANDLGLQPRQVAVWFQNRRARWKTKQLERDFGGLRAGCDALALDCDALRQENEALLAKVEQLRAKLKEEEEAKRHRSISIKEETLQAPPDSDSSAVLNEETSPYEGSDWRGERDLSFQYQKQPVVTKLEEESFSELFLVEPVAMPAWFCFENWSLMEGEC